MPFIRVPIGADGPVIDLGIWLNRAVAHTLISQGQAIRPPQTVRALIGTGADLTTIHPITLAAIGSRSFGRAMVRRTANLILRANLHDIPVAIAGIPPRPALAPWIDVTVADIVPADPHIFALIGRDLLAACQFLYDGPKGELLLVS